MHTLIFFIIGFSSGTFVAWLYFKYWQGGVYEARTANWNISYKDVGWTITKNCTYEILRNRHGKFSLRCSGYEPKSHHDYSEMVERVNQLNNVRIAD